MFLKNKNIIFKIRKSKVTDYAALMDGDSVNCKSLVLQDKCNIEIFCPLKTSN